METADCLSQPMTDCHNLLTVFESFIHKTMSTEHCLSYAWCHSATWQTTTLANSNGFNLEMSGSDLFGSPDPSLVFSRPQAEQKNAISAM